MQTINFDVNYTVKNLDADFEVVALNDTAGIMLNWGNIRTTEGVVIGEPVSYIEELPIESSASINIPENTSVVFASTSSEKDLEIDEDSYVVLSFQIEKGKNMTLFEMSGEDAISNIITRKLESVVHENTTMLRYTVRKGNTIVFREKPICHTTGELCWSVVTLYPLINDMVDFNLKESVAKGGLFPSDDLYPEDLYVYDKNGNAIDDEYNKATETYDSNLTYFKIVDDELVKYTYNENTWSTDWKDLYCCLYPYFGEWDRLRNLEVV